MTTAYITHDRFAAHELPGYQHPEHPGRIRAVWDVLQANGVIDQMTNLIPGEAHRADLERVHSSDMIDTLTWIAGQEHPIMIDSDTYALPESYSIARLAAGSVVQLSNAVLTGQANNGLAVVRPPGHHATDQRSMGFCLLNNIAIAARHALTQESVDRVLIVDYDVHHGNGTQDIFYDDPRVLFISVHQYGRMFYPGTGALRETGTGDGLGTTINVPLQQVCGDDGYRAIFDQIVRPAAERFKPQIMLVSAGFDAHYVDPLAMMRLSLAGYAAITRQLIQIAADVCDGKIAFVMEGGYDLKALSHGILNITYALLRQDKFSDPYGLPGGRQPDIQPVIDQVRQLHNL